MISVLAWVFKYGPQIWSYNAIGMFSDLKTEFVFWIYDTDAIFFSFHLRLRIQRSGV